jgi:hypothetical protein
VFDSIALPPQLIVAISTPVDGILNQYFLARIRYENPTITGKNENQNDC